MAKFVQIFLAAVVVIALVDICAAADEKFQCYDCKSCKEYSDSNLVDCKATEKFCYIKGNPNDESWDRGCAEKKDFCPKDTDTQKCTTCNESKCNSGSFISGSIAMSVATAAIIKLLH